MSTATDLLPDLVSDCPVDSSGSLMIPARLVDELMGRVRADGVELLGDGGLIAELTKRLIERATDEELTDHLG